MSITASHQSPRSSHPGYLKKKEARSGWSRTILAVRTRERISTPSSLEGRQVGLWKLIYSPVGFSNSDNLMEVEELESLLRNIIH